MRAKSNLVAMAWGIITSIGVLLLVPRMVSAHCDTLDGPVVTDAKKAIEIGDVTPVLKWVKKEHEGEIRAAFQKILAVRSEGREAKELADMYFFETVVRLHRAGEGAAYTGLKSVGTELEPAVAAADKSLERGSVDDLVKLLVDDVASGIRVRFAHAVEKKIHADESVEAGREFVEAYVEFVHYVEKLRLNATGTSSHHGESNGAETESKHHR